MQTTFAQSLSAPVRASRLARVQRRVVAEAATENGAGAATATLEKKVCDRGSEGGAETLQGGRLG